GGEGGGGGGGREGEGRSGRCAGRLAAAGEAPSHDGNRSARLFGPACHVVSVPTVRFPPQDGVRGPAYLYRPRCAENVRNCREAASWVGQDHRHGPRCSAGRG